MTVPTRLVIPPLNRVVQMGTGKMNKFPLPKDPRNSAWYLFEWPQAITSVETVLLAGPDNQLTLEGEQAAHPTDDNGVHNFVALFISGGTTNTTYRITLGVIMDSGETIFDAALIDVVLAGGIVMSSPPPLLPSLGSSGGAAGAIMQAQENMLAFSSVMYAQGGGVKLANPLDPNFVFAGIATKNAAAGGAVPITEQGEVENVDWNWTPGSALFVAPGGMLTASAPNLGIWQQVATARSRTVITVRPFMPIIRA